MRAAGVAPRHGLTDAAWTSGGHPASPGARQFVVQLAAVTMWSTAGLYSSCGIGAGGQRGGCSGDAWGWWVGLPYQMREGPTRTHIIAGTVRTPVAVTVPRCCLMPPRRTAGPATLPRTRVVTGDCQVHAPPCALWPHVVAAHDDVEHRVRVLHGRTDHHLLHTPGLKVGRQRGAREEHAGALPHHLNTGGLEGGCELQRRGQWGWVCTAGNSGSRRAFELRHPQGEGGWRQCGAAAGVPLMALPPCAKAPAVSAGWPF
jgi:hypothetical protein